MVSTSSGNIATIFLCIAALIHNYVNSDVVLRFYTCLSFPVTGFQRRFSVGTQKSQRYDLVVIGGGSGGLACSKQGKFVRSPITLYQLEIYENIYYKTVLPAVWMHALVITTHQPIFMTSQKVEMPDYEYFFNSNNGLASISKL